MRWIIKVVDWVFRNITFYGCLMAQKCFIRVRKSLQWPKTIEYIRYVMWRQLVRCCHINYFLSQQCWSRYCLLFFPNAHLSVISESLHRSSNLFHIAEKNKDVIVSGKNHIYIFTCSVQAVTFQKYWAVWHMHKHLCLGNPRKKCKTLYRCVSSEWPNQTSVLISTPSTESSWRLVASIVS